ncbi:MAG: HlyC/CorC family transporter [Halioglobus sp.]|nr:HlyC/CorC family transporter [Halioglobus sp.]
MNSLLIAAVLLAINAFFVAAEFALVKARGVRIQQLAAQGMRTAILTTRIQGNLESYLAACQLGITMASLGLGWVGEPAVAALLEPVFRALGIPDEVLHTVAFLTGFLLFSSLHIVIGEQVPKTWAIRRAEQMSMWCAYPLHLAYLLVWPLNWMLNASSRAVLRLMKVEEVTHADVFSDSELKDLVSASHEHGSMEAKKAEMLHNLLDFDQRNVARIMIPRGAVSVLDISKGDDFNRAVVAGSGHSRFPLVDGANNNALRGMVLSKSLYLATLTGDKDAFSHLADFSRPLKMVPESQLISGLFDEMRYERVHMAAAVDEYGAFVGIVTLEDLLEEIVGEIEDEKDELHSDSMIELIAPDQWRADGMCSLLDLQRVTGLHTEDGTAFNTLGGLVLHELQRFPRKGDHVAIGEFVITVKELVGQRISQLQMAKVHLAPTKSASTTPNPKSE